HPRLEPARPGAPPDRPVRSARGAAHRDLGRDRSRLLLADVAAARLVLVRLCGPPGAASPLSRLASRLARFQSARESGARRAVAPLYITRASPHPPAAARTRD